MFIKKRLLLGILLMGISACQDPNSTKNVDCPPVPSESAQNPQSIELPIELTANGSYTFKGKEEQTLKYSSKGLCFWISDPSGNQIALDDQKRSVVLPLDGKYTVQVEQVNNAKLSLKFEGESATSPTKPTKTPDSTSKSEFNQQQAEQLVKNWFKAKPKIFAEPFNEELAQKYTNGKLYSDITKSEGAIAWLKQKGYSYKYKYSDLLKSIKFSKKDDSYELQVDVKEEVTITGNNSDGKPFANIIPQKTNKYTYIFTKDTRDNIWKIADYQPTPLK